MHRSSLNHAYRVVWSDAKNMWVAVAETAKARGKGGRVKTVAAAVAATLGLLSGSTAYAAIPPPVCNGGSPVTSAFTVSTAVTGPCQLGNGGSLTVSASGSVHGLFAVFASHAALAGNIVNSGSIGPMPGPSSGIGLWLKTSTLNGNIVNSGTITGQNGNGIWLTSGSSVSGDITNSGTISSNNHGVVLHHSTLGGYIRNSGTISATGGAIHLNAQVSNTNPASPGSVIAGINNSGTIIGGATGINIATNSVVTSGITNSGMIKGNTAHGLYLNASTVNGGITNSGTIVGGSSHGVVVYNHSTVNGGITNNGTISGVLQAIRIRVNSTVSGGITNSGTLTGGSTGLFARNTSAINGGITNSGTISGGKKGMLLGIHSTISGGINNSGKISGATYGIHIYSTSTVSGGITNSGTISGGTYAIYANTMSDSIHIAGNNTAVFIGEVYTPNTPVIVDSGASYTMQGGEIFTMGGFTDNGTLTLAASAAGTPTGTINCSFIGAGTVKTNVTDLAHYGQLAVSGPAAMPGTVFVNLAPGNAIAAGDTLSGVIVAGWLTGTPTISDNSLALNFAPSQTGTQLDLVAQSTGLTTVVNAVNASGVSGATDAASRFDSLLASGTSDPGLQSALNQIGASSNAAQVTDIVLQTLPLLDGGGAQATLDALSGVNQVIQARIEGNLGLSSGDTFYGDKKFWVKPFGSWAEQGNRNGVSGYNATIGGIAFGADATISDTTRLGLALAYANAGVDSTSSVAPQTANINLYQLIGYGSHNLDAQTEINYQVDIGTNRTHGRRDIAFAGVSANANYNSLSAHAGIGIGRTYPLSADNTFTPSARVDYTWIRDDGYTETGAGGLNLTVNSRTTEALVLSVDGKFTHKLSDATTFLANAGAGYDTMAKQTSLTATYAGAPGLSFTTRGIDPSPWILRGGLGIVTHTQSGMEVSARYDVEHRTDFTNQTASVKFRWAF